MESMVFCKPRPAMHSVKNPISRLVKPAVCNRVRLCEKLAAKSNEVELKPEVIRRKEALEAKRREMELAEVRAFNERKANLRLEAKKRKEESSNDVPKKELIQEVEVPVVQSKLAKLAKVTSVKARRQMRQATGDDASKAAQLSERATLNMFLDEKRCRPNSLVLWCRQGRVPVLRLG